MHELINLLQRRNLVWHGTEQKAAYSGQTTFYPELDDKLEGGFPEHGVVDVVSPPGIGEVRLLMPYLQKQNRLLVYINPPGQVCAEQLHHYGIDISQVLVVHPQKAQDALWAAEQCMKSGTCSAVLLWQTELEVHQVKRLQIAGETGECLLFLHRHFDTSTISLPVTLGMSLSSNDYGINVHIRKRKGGWPVAHFQVDMRQQWPALTKQLPANVVPFPMSQVG